MNLAVPRLVFVALADGQIEAESAGRLTLTAFVAFAPVLATFPAPYAFLRLGRRTCRAPLLFDNTGNPGLPLALLAFGPTGLGYAVVVLSVTAILQFTVGVWIVSGDGNLLRALREPTVAVMLLGGLFLWQAGRCRRWR